MPTGEYYRASKWAMMAFKGGKCKRCGRRPTITTAHTFHFDHHNPLNSSTNYSDRWTAAQKLVIFSDEWFAWGETVDLKCDDCHKKDTYPKKQLEIDWGAQARIDCSDQSIPLHQLELA